MFGHARPRPAEIEPLVARFEKRYTLAEAFVEGGFGFAGSGTSEIRLLVAPHGAPPISATGNRR